MTKFVHIGIGKTGTTSIQATLAAGASQLPRQGFSYPNAGRIGDAHYGLFDLNSGLVNKEQMLNLKAEVDAGKTEHCILSSESFIYCPIQFIRDLKDVVGTDVRVVVYVREQTKLISSGFLQWVRSGRDYDGTLENFLRRHSASFDFMKLIEPWAATFGGQSIIANVYHPEVIGKNVVGHFLQLLGIRAAEISPEWFNPSLLPETLPVIREVDSWAIEDKLRARFIHALLEMSKKLAPASSEDLVTPSVRSDIVNLYSDSNARFALEYIPENQRHLLRLA